LEKICRNEGFVRYWVVKIKYSSYPINRPICG
jgi:hypothetical protein